MAAPENLPATMTAIEISSPGSADVLKPAARPLPQPGPDDVLIKVAAAGVNRPDILQRKGGYPAPPGVTDIPGLEIAGTVVALGSKVTAWKIGDDVCALVAGGGYATYCVAPAVQCLPIPSGLSLIEAAALPETFFTVWTNVFDRARLKKDEVFLVHGGSSGIGTTAIQLAAAIGATVFATAGSDAKCRACEILGATRGINYRTEDFVAVIKDATAGKGANVILDMVGGDYLGRNLVVAAPEARIVQIAFLQGSKITADMTPLMLKRLILTGSTLRPRSVAEKGAIAAALREKVWPLLNKGLIKPQIDSTFPLAEAAAAHRYMESSQHIGKIVLVVTT